MESFPCLICGGDNHAREYCKAVVDDNGDCEVDSSPISKQLNVIFILKYLLQLPTTNLQCYLEKVGNPDNWISLCEKCTQLTTEARSVHVQILKLSSKLRTLQNKILEEITKRPVNFLESKYQLKTNHPKMTVWRETRSFVQKHNYKINQATTSTGTDTSDAKTFPLHQQCPNCFTQIQIQLPQQLIIEEDAPIFHKCLYCTSEFPSITALLKHIQTIHEMQRLPCLNPNCDATSKNMKNFWTHRQRHLRKDAASKTSTKKMESEDERGHEPSVNFEDFNGNDDDLQDNQDDLQIQNVSNVQEEMIKSTNEIPEDDQEYDFHGNPDSNSDDDLQDNPNDKDNDWLPEEDDGKAEEDTELDVKPEVTETEDPACFTTVIKGGTRTSQQCPKCPLKFPSISSTLRHLSSTHHLKKLPCLHPGCKSALSSIKAYYFHRKIHLFPKNVKEKGPSKIKEKDTDAEGPCLCDICGAAFKKKQYLKRHKIVVHLKRWKSTQKKVPCHLCGLSFWTGYLKKHILFMHKDEGAGEGMGRFFQCEVIGCKLNFLKKEGLDNHMKKKHGGKGAAEGEGQQKQFKCGFCEKEFCFKRKLEQHELSHRNQQLGVRPFVCDICGKGFGVPQNLGNHLNYTHKLAKKFKK